MKRGNAHYKLVVGIIPSDNRIQVHNEESPISQSTNSSNNLSPENPTVTLATPEQNLMKRSLPLLNQVPRNIDKKLYFLLKNLRQSIADRRLCSAIFVFFKRKIYEKLLQFRPCDLQSFWNIDGVGEKKLEKYGPYFTSAIKKFCEENGTKYKNLIYGF